VNLSVITHYETYHGFLRSEDKMHIYENLCYLDSDNLDHVTVSHDKFSLVSSLMRS